ncbi:MAG: methyl-accepting chemotaxis protein [Cellvibrionaceae bacterium]|nr:methyl-accepting chemotaxis protein [Cellvibrionaceae bacterium]
MKLNRHFFENSYWLPVLILGAVIFLLLSLFLGYRVWENARNDLANIQQIREFQASSGNALFFAEKAVTGDPAAVFPLGSTLDLMGETVEQILASDEYTQNRLSAEFDDAVEQWRSIGENATVFSEAEQAIQLTNAIYLMNAVNQTLESVAAEAEQISQRLFSLAVANTPRQALTNLHQQTVLLRSMADNIAAYVALEKADNTLFERYTADFKAFERNHLRLIRSSDNDKLGFMRPGLLDMNNLLNSIRRADEYIVTAADTLLSARAARIAIVRDFDDLRFSLYTMANEMEGFGSDRFPRAIHAVLCAIAALFCFIGLLWYQRVSSQIELEKEQEEVHRSQSAILRLLDELTDLADGDLTISATVTEDFTGAIADSINFTIDQLRQLVSRINNTAVQVSGAAQNTRQTALHLAEASDHQAQEIAGASAAINEMAVTIDQVSANASESALVAGRSVSIANNGAKLVQNTMQGMDTIREQIQDTSKRIKRLGESSQEIGDIVSLINDIADQTNILALNAAIQASMAGDAGRGFAVVADEVQRLAERSAAATKQIESLVNTIQTDTNEAVISMEQTTSEVVNGARLAQDAGVALEEIEGVSVNLAELIQNISNAARQQASSAGHISNTMNVIQEITSQTSSGTGETAESIGELASMALALRESVSDFTLPEHMTIAAEDDHQLAAPADSGNADVSPAQEKPLALEDELPDVDLDTGSEAGEMFEFMEEDDDVLSLSDDMEIDLSKLVDDGDKNANN